MTKGRAGRSWRWAPLGLLALAGCGWATGALVVALTSGGGGGGGGSGGSEAPPPDSTPPSFAGATSAVAVSPWSTELRWSPATDNVTPQSQLVYAVYHATTSGAQNFSAPPLFVSDPGVQSFLAGGLTPNTTHYFVARARDAAGNQDANTVGVNATTPSAPATTTTALTALGAGRYDHAAVLLPDGRVLVSGGAQSNGATVLSSVEVYDPSTGVWSTVSSMTAARYSHVMAVLDNGLVIAVGGSNSSSAWSSAETYDPVTGNWTGTGNPVSARRSGQSAALLRDGRLLIAGGADGSANSISAAEVYIPSSGAWTSTGSMQAPRHGPAVATLLDGRVLLAGGFDSTSTAYLSSAEIYNPTTGQWSTINGMSTARESAVAATLPDGRVLVALGLNTGGDVGTAEIYNPTTGLWTAAGAVSSARRFATAWVSPAGLFHAAGGVSGASPSLTTSAAVDVFDPGTGTWSAATALGTARRSHASVLLPSGDVLVCGGAVGASSNSHIASTEIYGAGGAAASWRSAGALTSGRGEHTATPLPDRRVLIAGGFATNSETSTAEIYDPVTGAWTGAAGMTTARSRHTATLLPTGQVLIAGGRTNGPSLGQTGGSEAYPTSCELYDSSVNAWTTTGSLQAGRAFHVAGLLPDGRVLVAGGYDSAGSIGSCEVYDPATATWTYTNSLGVAARRDHAATMLLDGRFVVGGGAPNTPSFTNTAEVYATNTGAWSSASSFTGARAALSATTLADGRVLVAGGWDTSTNYNTSALWSPSTGTWAVAATLVAGRSGHAAVRVLGSRVLVAGGQTGPSWAAIGSCELYNPTVDSWNSVAALTTARAFATLTPLADGTLLVVGGGHSGLPASSSPVTAAERWDDGRGFSDSWRPRIDTVNGASAFPVTLPYGAAMTVQGVRFRGEVGTGHSASLTAGDGPPLVELEGPVGTAPRYGLADAQRRFVLPATNWAAGTSLTVTTPTQYHPSANPTGLGPGHYYLRVTVNGIPSVARIVRFPSLSGALDPAFGTGGVVTTNPSSPNDYPFGAVIAGSNVYVVGMDNTGVSPVQWRIEARTLVTGALVAGFGSSGVVNVPAAVGTYAEACDAAGTILYVVGNDGGGTGGRFRIEALTLASGSADATFNSGSALLSDPTAGADVPYATRVAGTTLYVAGADAGGTGGRWRIEAYNAASAASVTGFGGGAVTSDPGSGADVAYGLWDDGTDLYIAGFGSGTSGDWRIEKRSLATGALDGTFGGGTGIVQLSPSTGSDTPRRIVGVGSDIYVFGEENYPTRWRIEKRSAATGALDTTFNGGSGFVSIALPGSVGQGRGLWTDGSSLYLGGSDGAGTVGGEQWRVEKRSLTTGALIGTFGSAGVVLSDPSATVDYVTWLVGSATHVYAIGMDTTNGSTNVQWRIEKRTK